VSSDGARPGYQSSGAPGADLFQWSFKEDHPWYEDHASKNRDLLCLHDLDGQLISVNPAAAHLLGYGAEELLHTPMRELVSPEFRPHFDEYLQTIARDGEAQGLLAVLTRNGERRIWEFHNILRTEGVPAPLVCGVARDITDQKQMEWRLRESEERYRSLVAAIAEGVVVVEASGKLVASNQSAERILGVKPEQLAGTITTTKDWEPFVVHEDGSPFPAEEYPSALTLCTGEPQTNVRMGLRRPDGELRWIEANSRPLFRRGEQKPYAVVISFADITDRKRAEEAAHEANEKLQQHLRKQETTLRELKLFRTLLDHSNDVILVIDPQTLLFLDFNETACSRLGYSRRELLHMTIFDIDPVIDREKVASVTGQLAEVGIAFMETVHRRKDGTAFPVEVDMRRVVLDHEYGVAIARDITERKRAEEALHRHEAELKEAQRVARMGGWSVDILSGKVTCSEELYRMGGYEVADKQLLFDGIQRLLTPASWEVLQQAYQQILETAQPGHGVEVEFRRPDGTTGWVILRGVLDRDATGKLVGMHGGALDITDRKRAEQALRESEERLRLAQTVAKMGVFERKLQTGENRWMPEMEQIYGVRAGEFPKTLEAFFELVHSEDRKQVERCVEESMRTGEGRGEWRVIHPDGTLHWIAGRWRVFRDQEGRPLRVIGIDHDITDRKRVEEELRLAKEKLSEEKLYLEQEIDKELGFEEIVGKSVALRQVIENVGKVASSDATVLLLGETGTGKELVARALHRLSHRGGGSFIKMNCAAIPSGLLESELFGHEKGAFTGAVARKVGRLELADNGTLFLDEIGEIPLALQPKLLRVLQDMEFERLGGTRTLKVNFRLIAATNRDLGESVRENEFRSDLYYRLHVFPIRIPPLRERRDDIRLLVEHFVKKFAKKMNRAITSIPKTAMDALMGWDWPGNVRELENFIERSVILTHGTVLAAPLSELSSVGENNDGESLAEAEREHILRALRESHGRISGPRGAAERLGLKRTTLQSKLKQMGIDRQSEID
jgi:PAS domain S-box-containing protein